MPVIGMQLILPHRVERFFRLKKEQFEPNSSCIRLMDHLIYSLQDVKQQMLYANHHSIRSGSLHIAV